MHCTGFLIRREIEVDHALPGRKRSGEKLNWWTLHRETELVDITREDVCLSQGIGQRRVERIGCWVC